MPGRGYNGNGGWSSRDNHSWEGVYITGEPRLVAKARPRTEMGRVTRGRDSVSLVLPSSLYLGPYSAASSKSFLEGNSVTHILSIGSTSTFHMDGVNYSRLSINDSPSSVISKVVETACDIIDMAISSKKRKFSSTLFRRDFEIGYMVVAAYLIPIDAQGSSWTNCPRSTPNLSECWVSATIEDSGIGIAWKPIASSR